MSSKGLNPYITVADDVSSLYLLTLLVIYTVTKKNVSYSQTVDRHFTENTKMYFNLSLYPDKCTIHSFKSCHRAFVNKPIQKSIECQQLLREWKKKHFNRYDIKTVKFTTIFQTSEQSKTYYIFGQRFLKGTVCQFYTIWQ